MSHRLRAAHLALLLVALSAPVAASSGVLDGPSAQQRTPNATDTPSVGQTTIEIQLRSNGDARWVVTTYLNVTSQQERESFNDTAERFTDGETDALGLSAFERANELASEATGRSMNVTNVERSSDSDAGSLTLSFTWTNYARSDDEVLYVDDVYNTSEPWLSGLEPDQTLTVELPADAGVRSAPKRVQNGRIVWEGPTEFDEGDLELAYSQDETPTSDSPTSSVPPESPGSSTTADPGSASSSGGGGDDEDNDAVLWGGFFVIGLGIAVLSVYMLSIRDGDPFDGATPATDSDESGTGASPPAAESEPEATDSPDDEGEDDGFDEELLSDEERVERLLERNGGRMKQANIVKETGWSNAKVSQLLSSMAEDDQIDKLRIGRENLISFPEVDVTDIED